MASASRAARSSATTSRSRWSIARDGAWYAALDHGHFGVKLHRSDDRGATWTEIAIARVSAASPRASSRRTCGARSASGRPSADLGARARARSRRRALVRHDSRRAVPLRRSRRLVAARRGAVVPPRSRESGTAAAPTTRASTRSASTRAIRRRSRSRVSTGGVWRTRDGGATWTQCATGMRAEYVPPEHARRGRTQDVHCVVAVRVGAERVLGPAPQRHLPLDRRPRVVDRDRKGGPVECSASRSSSTRDDPNTAWFVPAHQGREAHPGRRQARRHAHPRRRQDVRRARQRAARTSSRTTSSTATGSPGPKTARSRSARRRATCLRRVIAEIAGRSSVIICRQSTP